MINMEKYYLIFMLKEYLFIFNKFQENDINLKKGEKVKIL